MPWVPRTFVVCLIVLWSSSCVAAHSLGFVEIPLGDGSGGVLRGLYRDALQTPASYLAIVLPGSGCAGFGPIADQYFRGLVSGKVLILSKHFVDPWRRVPAGDCGREFITHDDLERWSEEAANSADDALARLRDRLPVILVGISEGGEMLPRIISRIPQTSALVLIGSAGLDPAKVAAMKFRYGKEHDAWTLLIAEARSKSPNKKIVQGRTLKYWRSLLTWRVSDFLQRSELPILQAWGAKDTLVPDQAYMSFARQMHDANPDSYCALRFSDADHDLQSVDADYIQEVWRELEQFAKSQNWSCGSQSATLK